MWDPDEPARYYLLKISARETVNPAYFAAMKIPVILLLLTGTVYAQKAPDYTLHEWGTFTTVSGSDGGLLPGLQREEEGLPPFVHSHEGMENLGDVSGNPDGTVSIKGWIRPLKNVTVKMETPVIYFYTKEPFQAKVSVGFQGGSISQWYPARSGGETPPGYVPHESVGTAKIAGFQIGGARFPRGGSIDFAEGYQGSINWDVAVTPPGEGDSAEIFRGGENATWLYPRQTDSALVRAADGTAEKFLFYRGVGRFDPPVVFRMESDQSLVIENRGDAPVPGLLVYEMGTGGAVRFQVLDALAAGKSAGVDLSKLESSANWHRPVYAALTKVLMEAGLFRKEADAMLQTWWRSYFERPGLRVFWLVPETFTEKILPLNVEPPPGRVARVLVGRAEILTPAFERDLLAQKKNPDAFVVKNDRFIEAYNERIRQLSQP